MKSFRIKKLIVHDCNIYGHGMYCTTLDLKEPYMVTVKGEGNFGAKLQVLFKELIAKRVYEPHVGTGACFVETNRVKGYSLACLVGFTEEERNAFTRTATPKN